MGESDQAGGDPGGLTARVHPCRHSPIAAPRTSSQEN